MSTRKILTIQLLMSLIGLIYSIILWTQLPDRIPLHWNLEGKPDRWGSKTEGVALGLIFVLMAPLLTLLIAKLSPKGFQVTGEGVDEGSSQAFGVTMIGVSALFLLIQVGIGTTSLPGSWNKGEMLGRLIMAGVCLFFVVIGNVMGKVKRNFYMGVRTPWTLADEEVWRLTHRSAGRAWVGGGLLGALLALLPFTIFPSLVVILIISFWPVVDSYLIYRRRNPVQS